MSKLLNKADYFPRGYNLYLESLKANNDAERQRIYEDYARSAYKRETSPFRRAFAGAALGLPVGMVGGALRYARKRLKNPNLNDLNLLTSAYGGGALGAGLGAGIGLLLRPRPYSKISLTPEQYRSVLQRAEQDPLSRINAIIGTEKSADAAGSKYELPPDEWFYRDTTASELSNPYMKDSLRKSIMKRGVRVAIDEDPYHFNNVGSEHAGGRDVNLHGPVPEKHRPALIAMALGERARYSLPGHYAPSIASHVGGFAGALGALRLGAGFVPSIAAGAASGFLARKATQNLMAARNRYRADAYAARKQSPEDVKSALEYISERERLERMADALEKADKAYRKDRSVYPGRPDTRLGRAASIVKGALTGRPPMWHRLEAIDRAVNRSV